MFKDLFSGQSLNEKFLAAQGRPGGFDYMRLILALLVICWHSVVTTYGDEFQDEVWGSGWRVAWAVILPMFFALSGFLVAGSLERSKTLVTFLGLRLLRIVPALAGEVTLSALVLGPLVTALPLRSYLSDSQFIVYFLNILGDIHYKLPGVFLSNPQPGVVNGQLWTVPFELYCYMVLTALAITGVFKRRVWLLCFMGGFYALQVANTIFHPRGFGPVGGYTLIMFFVAGLVLYQYRDKIAWNGALFCLAAGAFLALLTVKNGDRFAALPGAYVTVYLGLLNPPRDKVLLSGDYSYGLFLYGYPLQQALMSIGPEVRHWYLNLLLAIPCAAVVAASSWWLIEKPALSLRRYLKQFEEWYLFKRSLAKETVMEAAANEEAAAVEVPAPD